MNNSHTKLAPVDVLKALYVLLEFRGRPVPIVVIPGEQWDAVVALVGLSKARVLHEARMTKGDLEWITTTAHQHAREWVEVQNINDAVNVLVAIKALEAPELFCGLYGMAQSFEPAETAWLAALDAVDGQGMIDSAAILNRLVESHIDDIAKITSNSVNTMRTFAPKSELDLWFGNSDVLPSKVIRNVALYGTFNAERCRELDKAIARDFLMARAAVGGSPVGIKEAVKAIKQGKVPTVLASAAQMKLSGEYQLGAFEQEMLNQHVVEKYAEQWRGAVSATGHVAFVLQQPGKSPGEYSEQFAFWPARLARNHIQYVPMPKAALEEEHDQTQDAHAAPAAG